MNNIIIKTSLDFIFYLSLQLDFTNVVTEMLLFWPYFPLLLREKVQPQKQPRIVLAVTQSSKKLYNYDPDVGR